ncbi:LLM class flavin-dependent oxidoreductase [Actinophytocola algeriensis]|uniref:Alkanesulfonate monooxygenase SsuD/methylene tetrahydromethanopterin reductase-like flavin-dependent oxidoreductase (Luciferase family) n=1 Tax=Actinophytocola algeriensis TaxID=1768010 RepID=A0A7W7QFR7_9PSEU|nr:LLM class flavin-dependent oxidoreductase [Actinophytocola algeriensis]MBB4912757.1 alkanesulfonate monooxygenase SsuD/methylene tetrahydromethanopterin reductase-like flavin-dependent oxidoreductase (luciferase family) [Actinophytocola algeriensis]MBE1473575.1 alkanesulfonate monooxygenase SsuD/methylene tetrahydromethanopterin reductase-like flavin-dependent oxidoreductase (luciferase family) [Actinophytocola algeriensis]
MRRLLAGDTVDEDHVVTVRAARLYTRPTASPPLFAAAMTPQTAREVASWADGLITVNAPRDALRQILDAFRDGGGEGKPVHLQVHLSWAETDEEVRAQAMDQWRLNALPPALTEELELPEQFDAATEHVPSEALESSVLMSADPGRHAEVLASYAELGIERVYLHQVGRDQERFLDVFGDRVLPQLR